MLQYIQPLQCSFCTNVCFVLFVLDIIMGRIKKTVSENSNKKPRQYLEEKQANEKRGTKANGGKSAVQSTAKSGAGFLSCLNLIMSVCLSVINVHYGHCCSFKYYDYDIRSVVMTFLC